MNVYNLGLFFLIFLAACNEVPQAHGNTDHELNHNNKEVEQQSLIFEKGGYFKSSQNDRIFTIKLYGKYDLAQIEQYAKNLPYTPGRMMAAYFYEQNSYIPEGELTLQKSIFSANDLIDSSSYDRYVFLYIKGFGGQEQFIDCTGDTKSDMCGGQ